MRERDPGAPEIHPRFSPPAFSLSSQLFRFLCLRAAPMRLLDSYNFMVGLALKRLSPPPIRIFRSALIAISRFPALCFLFAAAAAAAVRCSSPPFGACLLYIKIRALKTQRYTKSTLWMLPRLPLYLPPSRVLYPFLLASVANPRLSGMLE